jgi:wobble nucleotide-excising tRNase
MITALHLKSIATYPNDREEVVSDLTKVNFFYGANGSGKTTLSRLIGSPSRYGSCQVCWATTPMEVLVYNEDFVNDKIFQSELIEGVYTFGQDARDMETQILAKRQEIERLTNDISGCRANIETKTTSKESAEAVFVEQCWTIKERFDEFFEKAFTGYRGDRKKFKEKVLQEYQSNTSELLTLEQLKTKATTIFAEGVHTYPNLTALVCDRLLEFEGHEILQTSIIGKEGVNIGGLISKLSNSDWVKAGKRYLPDSDGCCPFCQQQTITQDFKKQIEEYFDTTFETQMSTLNGVQSAYTRETERLIGELKSVYSSNNPLLDNSELDRIIRNLEGQKIKNEALLKEKVEKPSIPISLDSSRGIVDAITAFYESSINQITHHNQQIANLDTEKATLTGQVWKFAIEQIRTTIESYLQEDGNITSAIRGLQKSISEKDTRLGVAGQELTQLEIQVTNVEGTIAAINVILQSFGFSNFRLEKVDNGSYYKVVRPGGGNAKKTLSEGEKTFLSFLYFYHLIKGSNTSDGTLTNRVVVFDDPISSLDSDVLFIVSSLIRELIGEVKSGSNNIKQMLILTHNVYFHKEVTFDFYGNDFGHWIVRKKQGLSCVQKYSKNPVKTSYQILWDDIREGNIATIRNTMRRILENYFKVLGGIDLDSLAEHFEGEDRIICRSLISWIHDGSHAINDDIFVDTGDDVTEKYHEVFKAIFVRNGHQAHYDMMTRAVV